MDCNIVHHNLFAYRENDLEPGIKGKFEAHIAECESCKKLLAGFQSMEALIEKARTAEPNPFIATRIIDHIEKDLAGQPKSQGFVLRPILVTLTVLGAIALGYTIGKNGFDRIIGPVENINQIENLKTELYIHDFIDENTTLLINE
jgi:predicted anti-sigma-YlaC factor YlaD